MREQEIIKTLIKKEGVSTRVLAKNLDYTHTSGLTNKLYQDDMYVRVFVRVLNELGYQVIVRKKNTTNDEIVVTSESQRASE